MAPPFLKLRLHMRFRCDFVCDIPRFYTLLGPLGIATANEDMFVLSLPKGTQGKLSRVAVANANA
jgi:hypothetical protein